MICQISAALKSPDQQLIPKLLYTQPGYISHVSGDLFNKRHVKGPKSKCDPRKRVMSP
jgi:hypothetical protein